MGVPRRAVVAYAFAVASPAAALGLHVALEPYIRGRPLLILFVVPILFSAYVGGIGPGLLATALAALGTFYFVAAPPFELRIDDPFEQARWLMLLVVGVLVSCVTEAMHRSARRAEEAQRRNGELEAQQRVQAVREAEAARLRRFAQDAPIGIVFGGADGSIRFANDEYLRIIRSSRRELEARRVRWDRITPPEWCQADHDAIAALGRRPLVRYEKEYLLQDGTRVPVLIGLIQLDGELAAFVLDVTEQRRAEEVLREADRRKDEFLGVLSHELRNPLAPIRAALQVLDRAEPGSPPAARAREIMGRQVDHLTRLVDDLLDVTRIAHGKVELERASIDLADVVRQVVDDHRDAFTSRDIDLSLELEGGALPVEGDSVRLAQVMGNLLHNSAKYTPCGGRVRVSASREDGRAVVRVVDTGVGIAPAILDRVFEPFVQAEVGLSRSKGGLGLGLPLARGLVELHGGTLEARSEGEGRGAELVVRLPLSARAPAPAAVEAPLPPAARRVLVVEDNVEGAEALRMMLELDGHEVEVAHDGREGVVRARAFHPDVVLCDIGLPELDGYEVARQLRADAAFHARLVAVTGYALPEDRRRAAEAGFDLHIAKPPSPDQLHDALARAPGAVVVS